MKRKTKSSETVREDRKRNDTLNKSDHKNNEKLPGDYPPNEDIMNRQNTERVGLNVENFSRTLGPENYNKADEPIVSNPDDITNEPALGNVDDVEEPSASGMERPIPKDIHLDEDDIDFNANESDVTQEDLQALGPRDLSMDMGEDEQLLKNRVWPVDMAGKDLDIPGAEGADEDLDQAIGPEDEENDFYSLGGDRHEDQMEGK